MKPSGKFYKATSKPKNSTSYSAILAYTAHAFILFTAIFKVYQSD